MIDSLAGECVFLNIVNIMAYHIKLALQTMEWGPELREFQIDLTIGAESLEDLLNQGSDCSEDITYIQL